ncbi:uncharacterized protein LOC127094619 [Lathyrus oleraceus]|uniref:uncharacterized protein LOC127094619 n=1 Tax=Pisum sativum TaxID=3888 RepID=UPI0021CF8603|nr:uncharacterized protein LOC127094619 [Pisum sativum]
MKNKSETLDMFKMYVTKIENQLSKKINRLRNDEGTEYDYELFNDFHSKHGPVHETTAPYFSEMNGKAERKNRTLTELVVAIMKNYESNDVEFYEDKFSFKSRSSGGTQSSHIPVIRSYKSNDNVETEIRRSKRVRVAKDYEPDYAAYSVEEDPINLQEVLSSLDADLWQEAINDEIESLETNKT